MELGHFDRALADFDDLAQRNPPGPAINALRGQALEGLKRFPEADVAFHAALSKIDTLPSEKLRNQIRCAYAFAVSARIPDRARYAFEEVSNDDPKYADALYGLGMLQANQGHILRAVEFFNQSLEVRPGFEQARRFRAILLARLGRFSQAEDDINLALLMAPKSGPTLYAAACVMALSAGRAASPSASHEASEQAVLLLKQALDQGYGQQAANDPDLANLKDNSEFQKLLQSQEQRHKVENHESSQL